MPPVGAGDILPPAVRAAIWVNVTAAAKLQAADGTRLVELRKDLSLREGGDGLEAAQLTWLFSKCHISGGLDEGLKLAIGDFRAVHPESIQLH